MKGTLFGPKNDTFWTHLGGACTVLVQYKYQYPTEDCGKVCSLFFAFFMSLTGAEWLFLSFLQCF